MSIVTAAGATRPREDLLGAYNQYDPGGAGLIAEMLFPDRTVQKRSGNYGVIPREVWLQDFETQVARDAESPQSRWTPSTDTFQILEYRHKMLATEVDAEDYADWFDLEETNTRVCARIISLAKEKSAAALVINETNFPVTGNTGATLSNEWDDTAAGTPIDDVETGKEAIFDQFGVEADTLVIPHSALRSLSVHPDIIERLITPINSREPFTLNAQLLAQAFGLKQVLVARSQYNSASPGATTSLSKVWNEDYAFLTKIGGDVEEPQLGWTMRLSAHPGVEIESWDNADPNGVWTRCREQMQLKLAQDSVGYLIKNIKS